MYQETVLDCNPIKKLENFENKTWYFTNFMKYGSGLQSLHRSGIIMLKPFEEGYTQTNKIHSAKYDWCEHF